MEVLRKRGLAFLPSSSLLLCFERCIVSHGWREGARAGASGWPASCCLWLLQLAQLAALASQLGKQLRNAALRCLLLSHLSPHHAASYCLSTSLPTVHRPLSTVHCPLSIFLLRPFSAFHWSSLSFKNTFPIASPNTAKITWRLSQSTDAPATLR
eukprot:scaffold1311_cov256-Pinguiococcus_pyrenoidosus.AAC.55